MKVALIDLAAQTLSDALVVLQGQGVRVLQSASCDIPRTVRLLITSQHLPDECDAADESVPIYYVSLALLEHGIFQTKSPFILVVADRRLRPCLRRSNFVF